MAVNRVSSGHRFSLTLKMLRDDAAFLLAFPHGDGLNSAPTSFKAKKIAGRFSSRDTIALNHDTRAWVWGSGSALSAAMRHTNPTSPPSHQSSLA
jgi:hypothetical protein